MLLTNELKRAILQTSTTPQGQRAMNNPTNIVIAIIVIGASFWSGAQYRDYALKSAACAKVEALALSFNRELAPDHKCRPYL